MSQASARAVRSTRRTFDFFQLVARQIGLFADLAGEPHRTFRVGARSADDNAEGRLAETSRELQRRVVELETLLDVLPVGIGIATDRECRDIRVNRAFREILGLKAGSNASKTAPPDERPVHFRVMAIDGFEVPDSELPMQVAARDGLEVKDLELNLVHDDGRVVRLLEYASPLLDEYGSPRGAVGAFVDVTEMQHALRDVARSEDRYRRIFDTAGVSIWEEDVSAVKLAIDQLRARGVADVEEYLLTHPEFVGECMSRVRILDVNPATLRMFGAADKSQLQESLEKGFLPETRAVFGNALLALARGDRRFEAEAPMRTLDGRRIHTLLSITFPPDGDLFDSVLVILSDITERKVAETALQQEVAIRATLGHVGASLAGELNTDRLVQSVTDAATTLTGAEFGAFFYNVTDHDGQSFQVYALTGAPKEAFAHFPPPRATALFAPTYRGEATIRLDDVTKDPRYGQSAPFYGMPEGHLPVRSYLAVPVVGSAGQAIGGLFFAHSECGVFTAHHEQLASGVAAWAAIALDNARLYRDVEQANRLKDEFLATLSHELRTPLHAVLGWAHLLRKGTMKPSMQARALESLERNARAQAQLVEDLLDVSRIMSGKLHIKSDAVDLRSVISNAVDTVRAGAYAKRLALEVLLPPEPTIVTGDADRLQQVVWNLVSNAIKFTPSGGRIEVQLHAQDAGAEIVVRDTGQGIAPSFQSQLFQRFRQGDASTARQYGGLGIGLSIVRHLTEAHGGTVVAESAGEGHGATFRVRLPLHLVRPHKDTTDDGGRAASEGALEGYRLLVVDDEMDARELVRCVLESRGAEVVTATSAGEALHLLSSQPFDALIADIGMPGQDGYSLIRALRVLPEDEATLHSGDCGDGVRRRARTGTGPRCRVRLRIWRSRSNPISSSTRSRRRRRAGTTVPGRSPRRGRGGPGRSRPSPRCDARLILTRCRRRRAGSGRGSRRPRSGWCARSRRRDHSGWQRPVRRTHPSRSPAPTPS